MPREEQDLALHPTRIRPSTHLSSVVDAPRWLAFGHYIFTLIILYLCFGVEIQKMIDVLVLNSKSHILLKK